MPPPKSPESSEASFILCPSKLSLVFLPHEIRVAIFSYLPDVSSVKALALTCSYFLHTFRSVKWIVLDSVLRAQIDPELWSLAIMVLSSSRLEPWSRKGVFRCLTQHYDERGLSQCTGLEALYLSELHKHVQFFAADFASSILDPVYQVEASPREIRRFERAFYRFELYCNLFRRRKGCGEERFSAQEQRSYFFARYPPWENEQLACVHDYLFEQLSLGMYSDIFQHDPRMLTGPAFNDVAEHDVLWGKLGIPYANDHDEPDNIWKEHYLSLGLDYLYRAATAANYDDRYKLVSPNLGSDELFLFNGLKSQDEDDDVLVIAFNTEEQYKYLKEHLAVDDDNDPFHVWRWAHADSTKACLYFGDGKGTLRSSGYVMWDLDRLYGQALFSRPWDIYLGPVIRRQDYDRRNRQMQRSFGERSKIWSRGGTGWWSTDDESKVQWRRKAVEKNKQEPDHPLSNKDLLVEDVKHWRNTLKRKSRRI